jgi:hypothetical protein
MALLCEQREECDIIKAQLQRYVLNSALPTHKLCLRRSRIACSMDPAQEVADEKRFLPSLW